MDHDPNRPSGQRLTVQEIRSVQLDVLDRFLEWCDRENLTCMAAYGTLLGAVRHNGYIPWDDDIDLMMPRSDYEELRAHATSGQLQIGGARGASDWPYTAVKICDGRTLVRGDGAFEADIGVNIDVFPIDIVGRGVRRRGQQVGIRLLVAVLAFQSLTPREGRSPLKRTVASALLPLVGALPRQRILKALDWLAQRSVRDDAAGVLVGSYQWTVPPHDLLPGASVTFEKRQIPSPANTTAVLTAKYGPDYMTPPPSDARVSHHAFTAYWR